MASDTAPSAAERVMKLNWLVVGNKGAEPLPREVDERILDRMYERACRSKTTERHEVNVSDNKSFVLAVHGNIELATLTWRKDGMPLRCSSCVRRGQKRKGDDGEAVQTCLASTRPTTISRVAS